MYISFYIYIYSMIIYFDIFTYFFILILIVDLKDVLKCRVFVWIILLCNLNEGGF